MMIPSFGYYSMWVLIHKPGLIAAYIDPLRVSLVRAEVFGVCLTTSEGRECARASFRASDSFDSASLFD